MQKDGASLNSYKKLTVNDPSNELCRKPSGWLICGRGYHEPVSLHSASKDVAARKEGPLGKITSFWVSGVS